METIKSYTSLEQSKKLAEFLPIESADMEYIFLKKDNSPIGTVPFVKDNCKVENSAFDYDYNRISCWSLTALLATLPNYYIANNGIDGIAIWSMDINPNKYDNLIDACYELILKLHDNNLL